MDGSNIITAKVRTNTRASSRKKKNKKKNLHARAAGAAKWPQICWQGFPPGDRRKKKEQKKMMMLF